MDRERVRRLAENLEKNLAQHMRDEDVCKLHSSLAELIRRGREGLISSPVDNVPGAYWFLEGGLSKFSDLEVAYYEFKNAISMGNDERYGDLKKLAEERKKKLFGKD